VTYSILKPVALLWDSMHYKWFEKQRHTCLYLEASGKAFSGEIRIWHAGPHLNTTVWPVVLGVVPPMTALTDFERY